MSKEEVTKEIKKYFELKINGNIQYQNMYKTAKVVQKFMALNIHIEKKMYQNNDFSFPLKKIEKKKKLNSM